MNDNKPTTYACTDTQTGNITKVTIGKANYRSNSDNLHISNWSNPPSIEELTRLKTLFDSRYRVNYQKIYALLCVRAGLIGGDTKLTNEIIAKELNITIRTVTNAIAFLIKHNLIAVLYKKFSSPKNGVKTVRMIRVWLAFYKGGCIPTNGGYFTSDIRPLESSENFKSLIPLENRLHRPMTVIDKFTKESKTLNPKLLTWRDMAINGIIKGKMLDMIEEHQTYCDTQQGHSANYAIYGYKPIYIFNRNRGQIPDWVKNYHKEYHVSSKQA
jgi:hypothetical protein